MQFLFRSLPFLAFVFCLFHPLSHAQSNPYENEILAFEAEDRQNWPAPNTIVFIGSSTINMWNDLAAAFPKFDVLNRGFGGSQTSDALFYVDRIATPYRPPLIVFYEGDNDLAAGKSVDQVFSDTTNFFHRVQSKSPNTHILYVSVKPSPSRVAYKAAMESLNDRVKVFTEANPKLHFADVYHPMLNASGQPRQELFLSDNLHMNALGYEVWKSVLSPILDAFAASYPIPVTKSQSGSMLIDFGPADAQTGSGAPAVVAWNNISSVGTTSSGVVGNLLTTAGVATSVSLQMVSRFNGANENGTTVSTNFPATATRDSLFGNTETFSGLANVTPIFKITDLNAGGSYRFTFYASRTGVSDNRQTRYTVSGASTNSADLNAANNIDQIATVNAIQPDSNGAITVALTPGPSNNNANHFTYLGVMRVESLAPGGPAFLFDFGAAGSTTPNQTGPAAIAWNNLTAEVGGTDTGILSALVATNGMRTGIDLQMVARFNGANSNGSANSTIFPASASQDSLFGNTELFNGLANVFPKFKFVNLDGALRYSFSFYASRAGVSDNRQTRYLVQGSSLVEANLNAANNVDTTSSVSGIAPDEFSSISISLEPGLENNNANHFTYLGVLRVNWSSADAPSSITFSNPTQNAGAIKVQLQGAPEMIYTIQGSTDLVTWQEVMRIELDAPSQEVEIANGAGSQFFRVLQ